MYKLDLKVQNNINWYQPEKSDAAVSLTSTGVSMENNNFIFVSKQMEELMFNSEIKTEVDLRWWMLLPIE